MFSTGQIIFAILFAIVFVIIIVFSYKKEKQQHLKNFKGVKWVAIVFLAFILILFLIKSMLKNWFSFFFEQRKNAKRKKTSTTIIGLFSYIISITYFCGII